MKFFKVMKRIIAMIVTVLIVVTSIQLPAFAGEEDAPNYAWDGTELKVNLYNNLTMNELSAAINEKWGNDVSGKTLGFSTSSNRTSWYYVTAISGDKNAGLEDDTTYYLYYKSSNSAVKCTSGGSHIKFTVVDTRDDASISFNNPAIYKYSEGKSKTKLWDAIVEETSPGITADDVTIEYKHNSSWRDIEATNSTFGGNNDQDYSVRVTFSGNDTLKPFQREVTVSNKITTKIEKNTSPVITFYEGMTVDDSVYEAVFDAIVDKDNSTLPNSAEYDENLYTIEFLSYDAYLDMNKEWVALDDTGRNKSAHSFGAESPETVRITFNGNDEYKASNTVQATLTCTDNREELVITTNENPTLNYFKGKYPETDAGNEQLRADIVEEVVQSAEPAEVIKSVKVEYLYGNKYYEPTIASGYFGDITSEKIKITYSINDAYKTQYKETVVEKTLKTEDQRTELAIEQKPTPTLDYFKGKYADAAALKNAIIDACIQSVTPNVSKTPTVEFYSTKYSKYYSIGEQFNSFDETKTQIKITYPINDANKSEYKDTSIVIDPLAFRDPRKSFDLNVKSGTLTLKWYEGRAKNDILYEDIYDLIADKTNSTPKLPDDYDSSLYTIEFLSHDDSNNSKDEWVALDKEGSTYPHHAFGTKETEEIRLSFKGDNTYLPASATTEITLEDTRIPSNIEILSETLDCRINPNWTKEQKNAAVWAAVVDSTTPDTLDASKVKITYFAGTYNRTDYWEELDYKHLTNSTHNFGAQTTERIKIEFAGNDDYKPFTTSEIELTVPERQPSSITFKDLETIEYHTNPNLTTDAAIAKSILETIADGYNPDFLLDEGVVTIQYDTTLTDLFTNWENLTYKKKESEPTYHNFGESSIKGKSEKIKITFAGDENYEGFEYEKTLKIAVKDAPTLVTKENPKFRYYEGLKVTDEAVLDAIVESTIPEDIFKEGTKGTGVTIEYYAGNLSSGIFNNLWKPIDYKPAEGELIGGILTHKFGKSPTGYEKVRISYAGDIEYGPGKWTVDLKIVDDRIETVITATEDTVNLKYYDDKDNLAAAIKAEIYDSIEVTTAPEKELTPEQIEWLKNNPFSFNEDDIEIDVTEPLDVQNDEHDVTVRYKGNYNFRNSSTTVKVKISKARARLSVADLETHTYDTTDYWPGITVKGINPDSNTTMGYIALVGGVDANVKGFLSIGLSNIAEEDLPEGIKLIYKGLKYVIGDGIDLGDFKKRISDLEGLVGIAKYLGLTNYLELDTEAFENILTAIDEMELGNGVKVTLGTGPKDAGVYVTTAVSIDSNYEFAMDMGSMIILQKGLKPEDKISLEFNEEMSVDRERPTEEEIAQTSIEKAVQLGLISKEMYEKLGLNNISDAVEARTLTIDEAKEFQWGGYLAENGEKIPDNIVPEAKNLPGDVQDNVHTLYIGMTAEGEIYVKPDAPTKPGVYSETVYVWLGNYFAMPITRVFRIQKHPGALEWIKSVEGNDTPVVLSDSEQDAVETARLILLDKLVEYGITEYEEIISAITIPIDQATGLNDSQKFDFGAYIYNKADEENKEEIKDPAVQANVKTLFAGVAADGKAYFNEKAPSEVGIYVELAYVLHGDYNATPIIRAFRIGKLATRIELACGDDKDGLFTVTYDGEPVDEITATLFEKMPKDTDGDDKEIDGIEPDISYIGYDDRESGLFFKDAPTNAGIYLVRASFAGNGTYLPADESAILVIEQAEVNLALTMENSYVYGEEITYTITGVPDDAGKPSVEYAIDAPILDWFYFDTQPKDVGKYIARVVVPATRNYEGAVACQEFTITPRPLDVIWGGTEFEYDGTWQKPTCELAPSTGYEVGVLPKDNVYANVSGAKEDAGEGYVASVELAGIDSRNYYIEGNETTEFTIKPRNISNTTAILLNSLVYNGRPQTQRVAVLDTGVSLLDILLTSKDYTVAGNVNTNVGKHTLTITGKGNYYGTKDVTYEIAQKTATLSFNRPVYTYTYGDKAPSVVVNTKGIVFGDDVYVEKTYIGEKANGEEYEISTIPPTDAGNYTVTATLVGGNADNYNYEPISTSYTILPKNFERSAFIWLTENLTYNGKKQDQDFDVYVWGQTKPLVEGQDYVVVRKSDRAKDAGDYTLKIEGINNYAGKLSKEFTVSPAKVKVAFKDTPYDNSVYKEYYDDVETRIEGLYGHDKLDIEYRYIEIDKKTHLITYNSKKRPTNAGEYYVIASINPKGRNAKNYKIDGLGGVVVTKYIVNPKSIKSANVKLEGDALVFGEDYTQPFTATIKLRHGKETYNLVEGKDFEILNKPEEITKPGVYNLVLKGKGNFDDIVKVPFVVLAKDDEEASAAGLFGRDGTLRYGYGKIDVYATSKRGQEVDFTATIDKSAVVAGTKLSAQELSDLVAWGRPKSLELYFVVSQPVEPESELIKLDTKIGNIFDVDYFKRYDNQRPEQLHNSGADVEFTVTLTDFMKNIDPNVRRDYTLIARHKGELGVIDSQYNSDANSITFKTHLFSRYYVGYNDIPLGVKTGDENNAALMLIIMIMALGSIVTAATLLYKKKDEE